VIEIRLAVGSTIPKRRFSPLGRLDRLGYRKVCGYLYAEETEFRIYNQRAKHDGANR
jgi:hypothetical protein